MGMIKRADVESYTRDAYVMDLSDLERRGKSLVEAANNKAEDIIRAAQYTREKLISKAEKVGHDQGFAAGHEEGLAKGIAEGIEQARQAQTQELDQLVGLWSEQLGLFEQRRNAMLEEARVQVVQLAAAMASRVVRRSIELDAGIVLQELESVLSTITESTRLVLSVHPDDAALVAAELPALVDRFAGCEHAQVVTDPALQRGSCVARTSRGGTIDSSINTQLDRIIRALLPDGQDGTLTSDKLHEGTDTPDAQEDAA
jgi:flagellar assembly protein FliH